MPPVANTLSQTEAVLTLLHSAPVTAAVDAAEDHVKKMNGIPQT